MFKKQKRRAVRRNTGRPSATKPEAPQKKEKSQEISVGKIKPNRNHTKRKSTKFSKSKPKKYNKKKIKIDPAPKGVLRIIQSIPSPKATFGMTPSKYKNIKNLPKKSKANLRDHMDDLELIFTMLGERMTTEISKEEVPDTFDENKDVAKRGGKVAGNARKDAEKELGRSVISKKNYLDKDDKKKLE